MKSFLPFSHTNSAKNSNGSVKINSRMCGQSRIWSFGVSVEKMLFMLDITLSNSSSVEILFISTDSDLSKYLLSVAVS